MTNLSWVLGNALLIVLILLRVPSRPKATFTNIDKNPKILDFALKSGTAIYFIGNSYLNIYN